LGRQGVAARLRSTWLAAGVLAALWLIGLWVTIPAAQNSLRSAKDHALFAGASSWLSENTLPGERIFQTDWDDFPRLFFYNTHNTYLIGLDPTYMQIYDPEMYDVWVDITQGGVEKPADEIVKRFGARYVISDLLHRDFLAAARDDPRMVEVFRDDQSVVFQILEE
jgi:hypothetical protein